MREVLKMRAKQGPQGQHCLVEVLEQRVRSRRRRSGRTTAVCGAAAIAPPG